MSSLAEFVLELFAAEIGSEIARARVGGRDVALAVEPRAPLGWMNGFSFQPLVDLRVDGQVVSQQEVAVEGLDRGWFEEPAPQTRWIEPARAQLRAWRDRMSARLLQIPEEKLEETMPFDIAFTPPPLQLVSFTLENGPPGARPSAGEPGEHAKRTAAALRALPVVASDEVCAFSVGGYAIRIRHTPDDADQPAGFIHLEHEGASGLLLFSNGCERGDAFTVDADEPLYRLVASWLIAALEATGLPQPLFPDSRLDYPSFPLSEWLLFGDHEGPPLDHRIQFGAIRDSTYAAVDWDLPPGTIEAMPRTLELYHRFVREVVAPGAP
jgi:hypothetical protein